MEIITMKSEYELEPKAKFLRRGALCAAFTAIAGVGMVAAAAIAAPALLPVAGALVASAAAVMIATGVPGILLDRYKGENCEKITQNLEIVGATSALSAAVAGCATVAVACVATPLLPLVGAVTFGLAATAAASVVVAKARNHIFTYSV